MHIQNAFNGASSISYGFWKYKFVNTVCAKECPSSQDTKQANVTSIIDICSDTVSPFNFKSSICNFIKQSQTKN